MIYRYQGATSEVLLLQSLFSNAGNFDAIHKAAFSGDTDTLDRLILAESQDVDRLDRTFGVTPLMLAAFGNHVRAVRTLLARGADPNRSTRDGLTALILAAHGGDPETVETLAKQPGLTEEAANEALGVAASKNRADAARVLIELGGAAVDSRDERGRSPLLRAAGEGVAEGFEAVVRVLLERGADPNQNGAGGRAGPGLSPLSVAAREGHASVVRLLLNYGADANIVNRDAVSSCLSLPLSSANL